MKVWSASINNTYKSRKPDTEAVISSESKVESKKSSRQKNSWAAWNLAAIVSQIPLMILGNAVISNMSRENVFMQKDSVDIIRESAEKIIDKTGLRDKGVHIKYWKRPVVSSNKLRDLAILYSPIGMIQAGRNAMFSNKDLYLPKTKWTEKELLVKKNSINMPNGNLFTSVFHEIGHAHNYNMSKWGKFAQSKFFRIAPHLASLLTFLVAFSSKRTAKEGEELSTKDKLHNVARDSAPFIPLAFSVPMFFEELAATLKGEKWAKKFLPEELMNAVKKTNRVALSSYIFTPLLLTAGVYLAKVIKDSKNKKQDENRLG